MAFASVLYPGRCLASQPIHLGSEVGKGPWFQQGRILNLPKLPAWWECIGRYFTQAPSSGDGCRVRYAHGLWNSASSHSLAPPIARPWWPVPAPASAPAASLAMNRAVDRLRQSCCRHRCRQRRRCSRFHRRHTSGQTKRGGLCCRPNF